MISLMTTIATIFLSAITSYFVSQKNSRSDYSRKIAHEILKENFSHVFFPSLLKNKKSNNEKEILNLLQSFSNTIENSPFSPYLIELLLACNEVISSSNFTKEDEENNTKEDKFEQYYTRFLNAYDLTLKDFRRKAGLPINYRTFFEKHITNKFAISMCFFALFFLITYSLVLLMNANRIHDDIYIYILAFSITFGIFSLIFVIYNFYQLRKYRMQIIRDHILEQSSSR